MKLKVVTMTGADNSVDPSDLFKISEKYPHVEWGILFSGRGVEASRFPSYDWVSELLKYAPTDLRLCAHLCGPWVFDALMDGKPMELITEFPQFQRVQLNTHGVNIAEQYKEPKWIKTLPITKQIIFQVDGSNYHVPSWCEAGYGVPLFDMSSGAGVLPEEGWPTVWPNIYCGYAGGLGPANINNQLEAISRAVGDGECWIDMETRIRSLKDHQFDLAKVEEVLEICAPYIKD